MATYSYVYQGKGGNTYYARLIGRWSGLLWDNTNAELTANPDYADQVIDLTALGGDGDVGLTTPTDLPAGDYKLSIRLRAGGSPTNTDSVVASVKMEKKWDGKFVEVD